MNRDELMKILPHRPPMLLIDEAEAGPDGLAHGSYTVRGDEWFLQGHFPGHPIVPGVIQCEMLAQTCCVLLGDKAEGCTPLFAGIDRARFRGQIVPGDKIEFECRIVKNRGPFYFAQGSGFVNGKLCVEGEFSFALAQTGGQITVFSKILIANRGEIAVRVIRACREMGISTVAVFSEADREALHVSLADEAYCIGPARAADSYLNLGSVLSAAVASGAQAIHPGYGLLSENAEFAALCAKCGIAFIGPSPQVLSKMGDKDEAKRTMREAGVPVIPGSDLVEDVSAARRAAQGIGYPLLLKARAGGGGRGIRLLKDESGFDRAFSEASQEAKSAFGDGGVYLEKYMTGVKHIEMQVLCDSFGNAVCLGERDCSLQRKNQKILEESPSPAVTEEQRRELESLCKKAVRAVGYTGAGTVEFLMDGDGRFYFMEMNTRLQVEHPVTEMVTGIDLVKWQIRVASGIPLAFSEAPASGHAIECRINAENPRENFRPSCGKITLLHIPGGPKIRFDTALYQDYVVPPYYDSMIGKLIVHAATREEAVRKMQAALGELVIEGVDHNREFLLELLGEEEFRSGRYTTGFLAERGSV